MKQYVGKRLASAAVVLVGVSILSFVFIALSGKDPAEIMARKGALNVTAEQIEMVRTEMGLDQPLPVRYIRWLGGLFTGDMGESFYSHRPIRQDLQSYLPVSFYLVVLSLLWIILLTVPISLICARWRNSVADHVVRWVSMGGICMPTFWLGFLLLLGFAVKLGWFHVLPDPGVKGYLLPSFTLALPCACGLIRLMRSALLSESGADYVQYAKARGLSPSRILVRHILRNAMPPVVTLFCQHLGYLFAGSVVVESVFSLSGIGSYLVNCVTAADSTATATCIVIIAGLFVLANLAGDILNRLLCPWMVREDHA